MTTFAERLKQLRGGQNLSQDALGKAMGISRYAVYTYENGKAFPTVEGLLSLAEYFDVSTDYLLGRTEVQEGGSFMFSERIRLLREERHLTQADVARAVGLSTRGYQDLELGSTPRGDTLLAIGNFYQVSLDWLMERTDVREVAHSIPKGDTP